MKNRTLFPKQPEIFSNDKKLMSSLKTLEDRIEQSYLIHDLNQSLAAITELIKPNPEPLNLSPELQQEMNELLRDMEPLLQDLPLPTQLDIDRDTIWSMASRHGKSFVLMHISPHLMMSLEMLFAGTVVSYIRMFNNSKERAKLDYKQVFSSNDELKNIHQNIMSLRNKQYAHIELSDGRHHIGYQVDKNGNITFDVNGPQNSRHYHLKMCNDLRECLFQVTAYLRADISKRSDKIIGNLSDSQKDYLRTHVRRS